MDDETKRYIRNGIIIVVCIIGGVGPFSFLKGLFEDKPEPPIVNYPISTSSAYEETEMANDDEIEGNIYESERTTISGGENITSGGHVYPVEQSNPGYVNYNSAPATSSSYPSSSESQSTTNSETYPSTRKQCMFLHATDKAHCGGSGICQRCGGDGLMDDMFGGGANSIECSSCGHSGKCSTCHGTGYID